MDSSWAAEVLPTLQLLNKLYSLLPSSDGVDLPSIVVVGSQSSGKSSVLERLSGVKLPRDAKLCTRAPIVLSMTRGEAKDPTVEHTVGQTNKCENVKLDGVAQAILHIMDERGEGISDEEIRVSVQSPEGKDLTVIDLPGIVYTENENIVKGLIKKYVDKKSVLILCVLDATQDVDAAEAVKISKEADPEGDRTIGVLTKVDRLDNLKTLSDLFKEHGAACFKLGLIAVRNPSTTARGEEESEEAFFRDAKKQVSLPDHQGIEALAEKLCKLQATNLKLYMPGVLEQVVSERDRLVSAVQKLKVPKDRSESTRVVLQGNSTMKRYLSNIRKANLSELPSTEPALRLSAEVDRITKQYTDKLKKSKPRVFSEEHTEQVRDALSDVAGQALPNFLPWQAFEQLVRRWTAHYAELTREAWSEMVDVVQKACRECVKLAAHPKLRDMMMDAMEEGLNKCIGESSHQVEDILRKEQDVVFTQNNYYAETLKKVQRAALAVEEEQVAEYQQHNDEEGDVDSTWQHVEQEGPIGNLARLLGTSLRAAANLCALNQSHEPADMQCVQLQLSVFAYDKVVRKRLVDDVDKVVRFHIYGFLSDTRGQLEYSLNSLMIDVDTAHQKLIDETAKEKERREEMEAKIERMERVEQEFGKHGHFFKPQRRG